LAEIQARGAAFADELGERAQTVEPENLQGVDDRDRGQPRRVRAPRVVEAPAQGYPLRCVNSSMMLSSSPMIMTAMPIPAGETRKVSAMPANTTPVAMTGRELLGASWLLMVSPDE
jgi:hypothetical protein